MLLELSVIPLGRGRSFSADLADLMKIIDASGLDYRLTPAGTVIEGNWDELMDVAKKCHGTMRGKTERVITLMKLDHYCPVKSRIESVGWGHRVSFRGSRTAARPVKWAFSRKG